MDKNIFVTQPSLAPLPEYIEYLKGIWDRGILTHNGPLLKRFETEFEKKMGISRCVVVSNGTIALQMAIKALSLKGEIITTPFTWIATVSAIKWEGCVPIFCDIDPETLNIDEEKIEALITDKTVAIMPVHVFGTACNVDRISSIAKKYSLKVIYDAAHAVGTRYKGKSLLEYGDISATSLHATKILNTGEGGACIAAFDELDQKLRRIRFFGHDDQKDVVEDGFNGKMTEIHAALGLANLKYFDLVLRDRKDKYNLYINNLLNLRDLGFQKVEQDYTNYSYFPLIFKSEEILLKIEKCLNKKNIFPRRYFYPSVNLYEKVVSRQSVEISEDVSRRILCLPLYTGIADDDIEMISSIIKNNL